MKGRLTQRLRSKANLTVFARMLIAKSVRFPETVKIAFMGLPFPIERNQGILETNKAEPVRVPVQFRFPHAPSLAAFDALVHHKLFLVTIYVRSAARAVLKWSKSHAMTSFVTERRPQATGAPTGGGGYRFLRDAVTIFAHGPVSGPLLLTLKSAFPEKGLSHRSGQEKNKPLYTDLSL
ncbi:MAG: hypothetical protein WAW37_09140 [Syntrophobacteraceae bacterium]